MLLLIAATHRRMARLSWTHCCLQTDIVYDWEWAVVIWILLVGVCVLCVLGTGTHPACATITWNRYTSWVCHYDMEPVHILGVPLWGAHVIARQEFHVKLMASVVCDFVVRLWALLISTVCSVTMLCCLMVLRCAFRRFSSFTVRTALWVIEMWHDYNSLKSCWWLYGGWEGRSSELFFYCVQQLCILICTHTY